MTFLRFHRHLYKEEQDEIGGQYEHTKTRQQYTEEFKTEAVRLVRDLARPVAQVARDLGLPTISSIAGGPNRPNTRAIHASQSVQNRKNSPG